jgi:TonB-linked SusC/RagA family outer membrane protein
MKFLCSNWSVLKKLWAAKTFRTMRLTFYALILAVVQGYALSGYAQATKLNLNMENSTVREVLLEIENMSEFRFLYNSKMVDADREVSVEFKNLTIDKALDRLFKGSDAAWQIVDRQVVLFSKHEPVYETVDLQQQQPTVSGTVTDESGQPLPGVTVVVKGTTQGTVTNAEGSYSLSNIPEDATLVFSFVGMHTQEVVVGNQTSINLVLEEETIGMEEIVVVGFGTQQKVNVTGAVSTVNSESLEARPVINIGQALQGIVPGLNITQSSGGNLSNNPGYNIRGITTIGTGSSGGPLILVDGMEGNINNLNPQDVENISVLKDAAASSIYGSRAPFGVILITTKKGKAGKAVINYSNNFRWNSPILRPKSMDSYTFALYVNDASVNGGQGVRFTEDRLQRILDFQAGRTTDALIPNPANPQYWGYDFDPYGNTDWYEVTWKDGAPSMEHSLNVSGGNEGITYFLSANYLHQNGLLKLSYDDYKRYNITAKIDAELSEWASIGYNMKWGRRDVDEPSWYSKAFDFNLLQGTRGWPTMPLYDNNGYLWQQFGEFDYAVGMVEGGRTKKQEDWVYHQFQLVLEPVKGWKIFGDLNIRVIDSFDNWNQQVLYNHDVNGDPVVILPHSRVQEDAARSVFINPNIYSEYNKKYNDHSFKVLLGYQLESYESRNIQVQRDGIIVPELPVLNLTSGTDINGNSLTPNIAGWNHKWATAGYFGRLNYNYAGRYLAEINLRYDGTSRFRSDQRWNLFPSLSLGWNVARESFWENIEAYVNTLKFRGSYGVLGNQNTTNLYPTYVSMPIGIANGSWLVGETQPNTASAPGLISSTLGWEEVVTYNLGVDIGLFKNRLQATFNYFERFTHNMVGPAPELPNILGTSVPRTNNTDLKTYGFEFDFGWQDRFKNGLGYNIHLLLSDSQTKILKYPNPTGNLNTYREGQMVGEIWGYTTIGIAKTDEEMNNHLASLPNGGQNRLGPNWKAGDIMFKDMNNDGKIDNGANTESNHGDLTIIGNERPRYAFGLELGADWKDFDFKAFLQGIMKRDLFRNNNYFWGTKWGIWSTVGFKEHANYFRDDSDHPLGLNLDSYFPRPIYGQNNKNYQNQTNYLQDASYLRLKNIQIGYTVPQQITHKVTINKLRVYASAENILTITKMIKFYDPETAEGGTYGRGNVYPLSKVYSFGVMVIF